MRPTTDFLPRVLPYLMGCPEPLALQAIVDSAITFCDESMALKHYLDPFNTVQGATYYDLDVPAGHQLSRVLNVFVDGIEIASAPAYHAMPDSTTQAKPGIYFAKRNEAVFEMGLYQTPDAVYPVSVYAALRPLRDTTTLDDELFSLWVDAVSAGAIARLMAVPAQPYSDPAGAQAFSVKALNLARRARIETGQGRMRTSMGVRSRAFA